MNFKKINNLTGWVVCLIACTVYILTSEAGGSFWDCGEFVSSCFKLQIPHPPGAPLFVMMGRFFIILFGDNPMTAAKAVNVMSALASGFTILFLFWTTTHFARRIAKVGVHDTMTTTQLISIMGAGVVGALAYTFSDSFWYSAVEGEVYACSAFFSAIVFWAILKWDNVADEPGADKWLVFIFFLIGLSIGVHLLCLLDIPAVVMVYYFRRRDKMDYKSIRKWFIWLVAGGGVLAFIGSLIMANMDAKDNIPVDATVSGLLLVGAAAGIGLLYAVEAINKQKKAYFGGTYIFFLIGCVLVGVVQIAVIQYSIGLAGWFDRAFVNGMGLPFFSGFTFFFVLVAILIFLALRFVEKKGWTYVRLAIWCFTFILIGYSTYLTTMIRSNADPAVDMYNVDNPMSLVGYLGRDQYGDFPLLYGQKFNAQPIGYAEGAMHYQKGKNKYVESGKQGHYIYSADDNMIFPRVWDPSNDQGHADYYAYFLGIEKYRDKDGSEHYEEGRPNQIDNIRFFIQYQFNWMFFRYFAWNFIGKQNDLQGVYDGNVRDGNWITGISFLDNIRLGDQSSMPDTLKYNKAHNTLFALPFILGLIGFFYHLKRRGDDTLSNFLLFFFTGFAIILYLNQAGNQPRERDYAYAGSFYAFSVWIGLGVMKITEWLSKKMSQATAATLATAICLLAVPVIMAQQEWDDHDRSKKTLARDLAKDYLESCAPNAILFSFGDNDTYPLWYAQEVEHIRPDIRVVNYSLLGIDWYINQLRYKVNESDPIDVIWSAEQIEGEKRNYVIYSPKPNIPENRYYDLYDMMKNYVGSDDADKIDNSRGQPLNTFPVKKLSVPVDKDFVLKNRTVSAKDSVVSELRFEIPKYGLQKNDLALLNIIAANKWQRPIYFTTPLSGQEGVGIEKYLRKDGLSYRLVPVEGDIINGDWMFDKVMHKFGFGNADVKGVYYDEENRRHLLSIRSAYAELASYLADKGKKDSATQVLEKADKMMLQENFPYGMTSRNQPSHNRVSLMFLDACYRAGDKALAAKVSASIKKDLQQQIRYYNALTGWKADNLAQDKQIAESYLKGMDQMEEAYNPKPITPEKLKVLGVDSGKKTK